VGLGRNNFNAPSRSGIKGSFRQCGHQQKKGYSDKRAWKGGDGRRTEIWRGEAEGYENKPLARKLPTRALADSPVGFQIFACTRNRRKQSIK